GDNDGGGDDDNPPVDTTPWPDAPPVSICTTQPWNNGPATAPAGAVAVAAGDNSGVNLSQPNKTYWFAPGVHTLGTGEFSQIGAGDHSTYIGAPGAIIDGQGLNKYAFSGSASHVTIRYLTVRNFISPRDEGVVNHNSGQNWTFEYNNFHNNKGGAVFLGTNNVLRFSCLKDNGQYGFQVYSDDEGGPTNVLLDSNEISGNNTDDWEAHEDGCGCTGGGKFWDAHTVTITNNYVHDNLSVGLWADTNDTDFLVEGNYIADNDSQGLFYEISYNMTVKNNNFVRNGLVGGPKNAGFPTGAIYLSESGGDSRVPGRTDEIQIYDNNFENNWSGVILWENADRYCASPNNTSSGTCTMVNPDVTFATCSDPAGGGQIDEEPYYSDCRWKTQNVHVHDNTFAMDKSQIPSCAAMTHSCGLQGIFANSGSSPSWSPYMGSVVQQAITFSQNNTFSDNTYTGDWNFMVKDQSTVASPAFWMAAPYNQDVGSTFNGNPHPLTANFLDENTATLEGSLGKWEDWFGETITQSSEEAHSGTKSLKVAVEDTFWGVEFSNSPGFPTTPGIKTASFWVKGSYVNSNVANFSVKWVNDNGDTVQSDSLPIANLTGAWQKISADITAPADAVRVFVTITSSSGHAGDVVYLDDIVIGDKAP
ncbi:MAG TPA: right-handed parallel beta-helix repeat-containing protein, partial [Candidatus Saccharimonadales bacterium]|nr:right-handed parallel beta-helix repeat-containing protein [Candidatus Saccharimonadales bacterium]